MVTPELLRGASGLQYAHPVCTLLRISFGFFLFSQWLHWREALWPSRWSLVSHVAVLLPGRHTSWHGPLQLGQSYANPKPCDGRNLPLEKNA